MRNNASRDEYVPQHSSRYETKGTSSRGLADARTRVAKIAAIGMLTLAVIYPTLLDFLKQQVERLHKTI